MEIVERDFGMPAGAKNRRSPMQDYSYLWCYPTPGDVDQYIALAQRGISHDSLLVYQRHPGRRALPVQ